MRPSYIIISTVLIFWLIAFDKADAQVEITEKTISIPTYLAGEPDPNPVFFNGRRYQGAQGRVYPYPLTHNLTDSVADIDYQAIIIENEYVEVCILPGLGGRIYYARDKGNDYYFLYYNRVIKPALIGMTGAWVSGGVEWNIPHHHRASSFYPVDYNITENANGSKTVWVGETELRHRTRWIAGVTLYPGSSLVETTIRVFNSTPYQNSILVWANAAVHANEDYQVYFPPKTQYATFHRKNQFTEWPVSYQEYDGADFREGVDVSKWVNHVKPTSFFEWGNNGNFVGGIDHGKRAGTVIFGDKYINPGKKVWSWGNNPQGAMWDKLLTDEDGPYVELMFGSFSDNQPDYSWIQTQETKETKYWFVPLKDMNGISSVNSNAIINTVVKNDTLFTEVNVTSLQEGASFTVYAGGQEIFAEVTDMSPDMPFSAVIVNSLIGDSDLRIVLIDANGTTLMDYAPESVDDMPMPEAVSAPLAADVISDPDSLYLAGLRFEQFHDPYFMPDDYYLRAIGLNPGHIPSNLRYGISSLKSGRFESASLHLEKIAEIVTADYTAPEKADPLYYLALAYINLGREQDAYELLYRASWDYNFHAPARYQLALIDSRRGKYNMAAMHLEEASHSNTRSIDVLSLMISMHRLNGENAKAHKAAERLLEVDPVNFRAYYEKYLVSGENHLIEQFYNLMRDYHENYLELAVGYGNAGLFHEAIDILDRYNNLENPLIRDYPMVYYLMGYFYYLSGNNEMATEFFENAANGNPLYCFPFRSGSLRALETAVMFDEEDALAWYLKGNIYFDNQPDSAIHAWEKAAGITDAIPVVYRNIAFAYANHKNDPEAAVENIERAISLDASDPRYYYEYDLYRRTLLAQPGERLKIFAENHEVVVSDQLTIFPYAQLLTLTGNFDQAIELMSSRSFHRWEGGESIYHYWLYANISKALEFMEDGQLDEALELFEASVSYPLNLQSVNASHETIAYYFMGLIAEERKQMQDAEAWFMRAADCRSGAPECDYFSAKAYERLKKAIAAESIFESMIKSGLDELLQEEDMDFFDPFARARSKHELQAEAYLKIALGYHGMGDTDNAGKYFRLARQHNPAIMSIVLN